MKPACKKRPSNYCGIMDGPIIFDGAIILDGAIISMAQAFRSYEWPVRTTVATSTDFARDVRPQNSPAILHETKDYANYLFFFNRVRLRRSCVHGATRSFYSFLVVNIP